jgi:hypothetical protein
MVRHRSYSTASGTLPVLADRIRRPGTVPGRHRGQLPRTPLLGTWVNRGKTEGPELGRPGPLQLARWPTDYTSSATQLLRCHHTPEVASRDSYRFPAAFRAGRIPQPRQAQLRRTPSPPRVPQSAAPTASSSTRLLSSFREGVGCISPTRLANEATVASAGY